MMTARLSIFIGALVFSILDPTQATSKALPDQASPNIDDHPEVTLITWTGNAHDNQWFTDGNWDLLRHPRDGDSVITTSGGIRDSAGTATSVHLPSGALTVNSGLTTSRSLVVDSGATVYLNNSANLQVGQDVIINGSIAPGFNATPTVFCNGSWIPRLPTSFDPLNSVVTFTGRGSFAGQFFQLVTDTGSTMRSLGNLFVQSFIEVKGVDSLRRADTLFIQSADPGGITPNGEIIGGTIQRLVDRGYVTPFRFESDSTYVFFGESTPDTVEVRVSTYPDIDPGVFGDDGQLVGGTVDTISHSIRVDGIHFSRYSRWVIRIPRPIESPNSPADSAVRRVYVITFQGDTTVAGSLSLRYDPSEVPLGLSESSLRLYRSYNVVEPPVSVQLASFTGTFVSGEGVLLHWTTLSEIHNYGFSTQRRLSTDSVFADVPNSFVQGHGTTNEPHEYEWIDSTVPSGLWYYRLKQLDFDGSIHYSDAILVNAVTNVGDEGIPRAYSLSQNYPNPWNPATTIRYGLPHTSFVTLTVFNTLGQRVAQLVNEQQQAGYHDVVLTGGRLASGLYFYRIQAGNFVQTKKLILLK